MNKETFLTLKSFGMLEPFEGFILTADCSRGRQEEDPVGDAIDAISETQQEIKEEISELKSQLGEVLSKVNQGSGGGGGDAIVDKVKAEFQKAIKKLAPKAEQIRPQSNQNADGTTNEALEAVSDEVAQVKAQGAVLQDDLNAVRGDMAELKDLMNKVLTSMPSKMSYQEEQKVSQQFDQDSGSKEAAVGDTAAQEDSLKAASKPRGRHRTRKEAASAQLSPKGSVLLNLKEAYEQE